MRVIARIPDVTAAPASGPTPAGRPVRPAGRRDAAQRPDWLRQTWPMAALAAAAAVAWVLAARNEHVRLEQQRGEVRVARETVSTPGVAAPAAGGGAVVR